MFYLGLIRDICWTIYSGTILSFALLVIFQQSKQSVLLSWFREFGVILGLSLGGSILTSIAIKWDISQHFYPNTYNEKMGLIFGLMMWISNMILEIWTLDPLRKSDLGILPETLNIMDCENKSKWHLCIHGLFVVLTSIFLTSI